MYFYKCECQRVIDGDSVKLDIDLGCWCHFHTTARLLGINAPEITGPTKEAGLKTMRRLIDMIAVSGSLYCRTHLDKRDKYGRLLVELFPNERADVSLNHLLVKEGLAVVIAG